MNVDEYKSILKDGWDSIRAIQGNKKASILRYTLADDGREDLGVAPTKTLVSGLSNLDVAISRVSTKEVADSRGILELTDMVFGFWDVEVKETDQILYPVTDGKTYNVVQIRDYDPDVGPCNVIGRAV